MKVVVEVDGIKITVKTHKKGLLIQGSSDSQVRKIARQYNSMVSKIELGWYLPLDEVSSRVIEDIKEGKFVISGG